MLDGPPLLPYRSSRHFFSSFLRLRSHNRLPILPHPPSVSLMARLSPVFASYPLVPPSPFPFLRRLPPPSVPHAPPRWARCSAPWARCSGRGALGAVLLGAVLCSLVASAGLGSWSRRVRGVLGRRPVRSLVVLPWLDFSVGPWSGLTRHCARGTRGPVAGDPGRHGARTPCHRLREFPNPAPRARTGRRIVGVSTGHLGAPRRSHVCLSTCGYLSCCCATPAALRWCSSGCLGAPGVAGAHWAPPCVWVACRPNKVVPKWKGEGARHDNNIKYLS